MPNYVELSAEEWAQCNRENGYRIVGSSEGGYSMDGPGGDMVMWDDDAKKPYRVVLSDEERRQARYLEYLDQGMDSFEARELSKQENAPIPEICPECGKSDQIKEGGGYVGETVLYCDRCHRLLWEDSVDAVRRVI